MGKRQRYRDHIDPEALRWGSKYPSFPGVAECARLIKAHKATGTWAEMIVYELADNAEKHLDEILATYRETDSGEVRMYLVMALELAALPKTVEFFSDLLREGDPLYVPYARRALVAIDTKESRRALYEITQPRPWETDD